MNVENDIKTMVPRPRWLKAIWAEAKRKGTDKLTLREISAEIAAYRREQRRKTTNLQSREHAP